MIGFNRHLVPARLFRHSIVAVIGLGEVVAGVETSARSLRVWHWIGNHSRGSGCLRPFRRILQKTARGPVGGAVARTVHRFARPVSVGVARQGDLLAASLVAREINQKS